jgi:glutamate/tyrosine decarboxylase-like PLP-dependent enzyme
MVDAWSEFSTRMRGNYPFFHPRFAGQMLKPPHPIAVAGYLATMLINPNNHALDGGPVTSQMEKEVVAELAKMFHLPTETLGHLTSSGTIANLEALWVSRELAPGKRLLYGANSHYTHGRMCSLLGIAATKVGVDACGHLDLNEVDLHCKQGDVGTIVLSAGSTGLGAVDDIHEALALRARYGVRLHVDAAYGGFFALFAWSASQSPSVPSDALRAISECDSVVVDPHKHGLQPYGCGAVLFANPKIGTLYQHDSPYTYFSSDQLHLGAISLECSRAGASAAALWLTLRSLPLSPDFGFGPILAASRRAALLWAKYLAEPGPLRLHTTPDLDIVTYFPYREGATPREIDITSRKVLIQAMNARDDPIWLSTLRVDAETFAKCHPDIRIPDQPVSVLRSVLMKPEHELWVDHLHARVSTFASQNWQSDPNDGENFNV